MADISKINVNSTEYIIKDATVYGFDSFLPENTDMDTVLTPGAYGIASGAVAQTFTNLPEPYAGRAEVFYTYGQDRLMQIYYPTGYTSRYYYLRTYSGSWGTWRKFIDESKITDNIYGTTTTIAPASGETYDLNDLPIGRFQVSNSTYAGRILNGPTTSAGYEIECFYNGVSTYKTQIAIPNRSATQSNIIYIRHYNTVWSSWVKMLSEGDVDSVPTVNSTNVVTSGGVHAPLAELIDSGAKNKIEVKRTGRNNTGASAVFTDHGVQFTVNADNTITVERTATDTTDATVWLYDAAAAIYVNDYNDGKYIFSIGYSGSSSTIQGRVKISSSGYTSFDEYVIIPTTTYSQMNLSLVVSTSFTGTATIKPMVCSKVSWDISNAYVPYCPSMQEMYAMIKAL